MLNGTGEVHVKEFVPVLFLFLENDCSAFRIFSCPHSLA